MAEHLMKKIVKIMKNKINEMLPIYFPKNREFTDRLHLAIWNCGTRPTTLFNTIRDIRITIRKNYKPILVIKNGNV